MTKKMIPQLQVRSNIRSGEGGGWVDGTWYSDRSGVCGAIGGGDTGGSGVPGGSSGSGWPGTSGGYAGSTWVPDRSGSCG